jgi:phosphatidylglycerol---prolipoprotein diacylglyceryl transferase
MIEMGLPWAGNFLVHDAFVGLGVAAAVVVFAAEKRRRGMDDDRLWAVVAMSLGWGAVFSRLGTWVQHLDPGQNAGLAEQWLYGNRSILAGLAGAYAGALVGKRVTGYRSRTGDLFAPAVAVGMTVGRIGCLLTETPGTPTGGAWGVALTSSQADVLAAPAGVPLHPSFLYEVAFHALTVLVLWHYRDRLARQGDLLTCYLAAYATFRFGVELVRANEVAWAGLTRSQLFLLPFLPLLLWRAGVALGRRSAPVPSRELEAA